MRRNLVHWTTALLLACSALSCERTPVASSTPVAVSATAAPLASAPTPRGEPTAGLPSALGTGMAENVDPPIQLETRLIQDLKAGERRPLVLFLHGLGGSAKLSFETTPLAELGARDRVHVIAADGTLDSGGRRFWNAGKACCNFDDKPIDDVARLGALLDTWSQRPDVDPARVYVAGYSNGGFMAHRLACERGDKLAAVAALAAGVEAGSCPKRPRLSVLMVNGDADAVVRYSGGQVFHKPGLGSFLPAAEGLREWGRRLGCSTETARRSVDLDPQLPGPETASLGFAKCEFGDAELLSIHGGTHHLGSRRGVVEAAWKFLLSHRKH